MTIDKLNSAIRKAIIENNHYAALALALAMPDICGKLEYPNKKSEDRFKIWFDKYMKHVYETNIMGNLVIFMTGADCYALRCALLHEASDEIINQRARVILEKIQFTTLNIHKIKTDNILSLNVNKFCEEVCIGVDQWIKDVSNDIEIMKRIDSLLNIQESGYNPIPGVRIG